MCVPCNSEARGVRYSGTGDPTRWAAWLPMRACGGTRGCGSQVDPQAPAPPEPSFGIQGSAHEDPTNSPDGRVQTVVALFSQVLGRLAVAGRAPEPKGVGQVQSQRGLEGSFRESRKRRVGTNVQRDAVRSTPKPGAHSETWVHNCVGARARVQAPVVCEGKRVRRLEGVEWTRRWRLAEMSELRLRASETMRELCWLLRALSLLAVSAKLQPRQGETTGTMQGERKLPAFGEEPDRRNRGRSAASGTCAVLACLLRTTCRQGGPAERATRMRCGRGAR